CAIEDGGELFALGREPGLLEHARPRVEATAAEVTALLVDERVPEVERDRRVHTVHPARPRSASPTRDGEQTSPRRARVRTARPRRPDPEMFAIVCLRPRRAGVLLRLLVLHLLEAAADLRGAEPAVSAKGPNRRDLSGPCPAGHGLRVHPEQRSHLGR